MSVTLETVVQHYGRIDRRVEMRQDKILHQLRSVAAQNVPVAEILQKIILNISLVIDYYGLNDQLITILNQMLDKLLTIVESGSRQLVEAEWKKWGRVIDRCEQYMDGYKSAVREMSVENPSDLILVGSMAFQNYCLLNCLHCCNAGTWDNRQHRLDDVERALPKIRFPALSKVHFTYHEPFSLPFLLDAVKMILARGGGVALVTSALGISKRRRSEIMNELTYLNGQYEGKVEVKLSFDLFRRKELGHYLNLIAGLIDAYPFISELKFTFSYANREYSLRALEQLRELVNRKTIVDKALAGAGDKEGDCCPVGRALSLCDDPLSVEHYLNNRSGFLLLGNISPSIVPFMLFAGGYIVPRCTAESAHFRSLGNVFEHSARYILQRFDMFEAEYCSRRSEQFPYPALIMTERAMREDLGIDAPLITHFDTAAALHCGRSGAGFMQNPTIQRWIEERKASMQGIELAMANLGMDTIPLKFSP